MSTLKDQIAARKKQAEDREITRKAWTVGEALGKKNEYNGDHESEKGCAFSNADLVIKGNSSSRWSSDGGGGGSSSTVITYKGETVYEVDNGGIQLYLPGEWEDLLDGFFGAAQSVDTRAKEACDKDKKAADATKEADLRKKWKL